MAHSMAYSSAAPSRDSLKGLPVLTISTSLLSIHLALRYRALSVTQILMAISASLFLIAPKLAIAVLNCSRVVAYSIVVVAALLQAPSAAAHSFKRPIFKILKAII